MQHKKFCDPLPTWKFRIQFVYVQPVHVYVLLHVLVHVLYLEIQSNDYQ